MSTLVLKGEPGLGGIMKYLLQLNYSDTNSLTPIECPTVRIQSNTNELELVKTPQFKVLLKTVSPSDTSGKSQGLHALLTDYKLRSSHDPFSFNNLLEQLTELTKHAMLMIIILLSKI